MVRIGKFSCLMIGAAVLTVGAFKTIEASAQSNAGTTRSHIDPRDVRANRPVGSGGAVTSTGASARIGGAGSIDANSSTTGTLPPSGTGSSTAPSASGSLSGEASGSAGSSSGSGSLSGGTSGGASGGSSGSSGGGM